MGTGMWRGMATRSPVRSSPSGVQPEKVRNGWLADAFTSRPDASRSRYTSFVPDGKTLVIGAGTSLCWSSTDQTRTPSPPSRISSPKVTGAPVSARSKAVSSVMQPDSRKSDSRGLLSVRCSGPRLSWDNAMTGTSSSLASSLSDRDISETSCCRFSTRLGEDISCR